MNIDVIQACRASFACLKLKNRLGKLTLTSLLQDFHDISGKNAYSWVGHLHSTKVC